MASPVDYPTGDRPLADGQSKSIKITIYSRSGRPGRAKWYDILEMSGGGDGLESNPVPALGRAEPIGETRGSYKADDLTLTMTCHSWRDFREDLGDGYGERYFKIDDFVNVPTRPVIHTESEFCRIKKVDDRDAKTGNEALQAKLTISQREVVRDGKRLFRTRRRG